MKDDTMQKWAMAYMLGKSHAGIMATIKHLEAKDDKNDYILLNSLNDLIRDMNLGIDKYIYFINEKKEGVR